MSLKNMFFKLVNISSTEKKAITREKEILETHESPHVHYFIYLYFQIVTFVKKILENIQVNIF